MDEQRIREIVREEIAAHEERLSREVNVSIKNPDAALNTISTIDRRSAQLFGQ